MPIIRVALNVPIDTLFDYQAEDANENDIGLRACVPFGKKLMTGIIMAIDTETQIPLEKLKSVHCIFREVKPLSIPLLDLFRFCSQYYHYPLGPVIVSSLPVKLRSNKPAKLKEQMDNGPFGLTTRGEQINLSDVSVHSSRIACRLLTKLHEATTLTRSQVRKISPQADKILEEWIQLGWVSVVHNHSIAEIKTAVKPTLTPEQATAVNTITADIKSFNTWLLHGVTGSGKTEVYLRIIESVLARGRQALILIPEISLTPQLESIFRTRFPNILLANLHSGLNDTERLSGWIHAQQDEAKIILGTRLAIFTPLPNLGLIIVDEEQDSSFKQQDGLRYSARDLAIFRARQMNIPIILGSATPSLESYYNALTCRYRSLRLRSRAILNAVLPSVQYIDIRLNKTQEGLSEPLIKALGRCLEEKHQSLVFINRRGYAPVLLCKSCAWIASCQRCFSRLVVHLRDKKLCCHHCGHQESFPRACPQCGNQDISSLGQGTQRVEEALATHFPAARILRVDRDSIRRKNGWQNILQKIHAQEVDILVGTQLLAKGHHFPHLSLIGILNPDASLYSTDFRASEHLFAQLMQVTGRAGRANIEGHVLIQTEFPDHPLYSALQKHDYDTLAQTLLSERKVAGFPPFVYQALLRAEAHHIKTVSDFLMQASNLAMPPKSVEIFDPVPSQMPRLKGLERAHLLVQSESRKQLQAFLDKWYIKINSLSTHKVRWILDVDPFEF